MPCCDKRFLAVGAGFRQVSFGADSSAEQVPGFKSPAQVWLVPRGVLAKIRRHGRMGPVWAVWAKVPMRFFGTIDGAHCCMPCFPTRCWGYHLGTCQVTVSTFFTRHPNFPFLFLLLVLLLSSARQAGAGLPGPNPMPYAK